MLDTYDDTAVMAESASEQSAPTAEIAAEQQGPSQEFMSHVGRIDTLIHAAEQVLPAGVSHQAGQSVTPLLNRSDDVIYKNMPEFLASATSSATINSYFIEVAQEAPEEMLAILTMDEDDLEDQNFNHPLAQAAKSRLMATKMAREAHQEMTERFDGERKRLNKEQQEFLAEQNIDLGDGRSASALDVVNGMDKMLDNWDQSFDEMVDQGIAEPQDKDKLKSAMTRYRNMMADTNLSAAEKQKLREKMIASGEITQAQMDYADKLAIQEQKQGRINKNEVRQDQQVGKQQVSVEARAAALAEEESPLAKTTTTPSFSTAAPSGIDTNVKLTETYNAKASAEAANDRKQAPAPAVVATSKAPTQVASGDMGFG